MDYFPSKETAELFNAVGDNIFILDMNFQFIWMNDFAVTTILKYKPFTPFQLKEEMYGRNVFSFNFGDDKSYLYQLEELERTDDFPFETTITLFNKISAAVAVNPFTIAEKRIGYVVICTDVTEYENQMASDQKLLEEMYSPILDTSLSDVILIPVSGSVNDNRFTIMRKRILEECERRQATAAIFDFTGLTTITDPEILEELQGLKMALHILGVEAIFCGIKAELAYEISNYRLIETGLKIFPSFKHSIMYLWDKRGLIVPSKESI